MKWSEKKVCFSSAPIKSSASPNGSDENDRSNQQMGLNLQKPKKQTVKTFMSPTVCVASKASFPRKKILAERNEFPGSNSSNTHLSKTPSLDSKPSPKTSPKALQKNSPNLDPKVTSKEPSSQKTPLSYNSRDVTPSRGPYDPFKNYLSPRPQFLRYNPSRRKEIFLRLEMEDKEGDDRLSVSSTASFDSKNATAESDEDDIVSSDKSSLASSFLLEDEEFGDESGSFLEQEDEEFDTESEEEAEEEVAWSLRGVLKYFLLSVVLVLTTSYISSMNSPTSARAFEGLTLGNQKFQNHSYRIAEGVEVGYKFLDGKQEQLGLLGFTQAITDEVIEEEMTENVNMVEEVKKDGKSKDACEEELIMRGEASDEFAEDVELQEKGSVGKIEVQKAEEVKENVIEDELVKTGKVSDQLVEQIELQEIEETGEQIEDVKENAESQDVTEEELVETGEVSGQMVGDIEHLGQETAEEIEFLQGDQASLLSEGTDHQESSSRTADSSEKIRVAPKEAGEEIHKETRDNDMVQAQIIQFGNAISMGSAVTMLERWGKSVALNFEEVNPLKGLNQQMGTEIFLKVMFGFLTCAAIVSSFVLGSNNRRKGIASKQSSLVDKHSIVKEKPNLVLPAEREEQKKHVNSFLNTKPLISSVGKDNKETYQSRAPLVELLGELEVGGISSSLKSCAIKSRMKDEVSNYSDFLEKGLGSKAYYYYSAPVQDQQGLTELSTVNSNLSGRLTANKKLLGKEFGNNDLAGANGEGMNNVVTTPLRRSARIRNRTDIASS